MEKFLILLCLAWFVAGGVIVDRSRQDSQSIQGGENGGGGQIPTVTRDQLLQQKFILDILQKVESPLQNQNLLELNMDGVLNENMYLGPLDENMRLLLDLIQTTSAMGRKNGFSVNNEEDMRQMAGLYQLLVRSRDFKAFQRTAVHARIHVSPVLFVNALILAMADRADTKMLISPALYEILPKLYQDPSLVRQVEMMTSDNDNNGNSIRPNILDVISLGRQTKQMNLRPSEGIDGLDYLNRAQLWMPWRDMHQQLAIQNSINRKVIRDKTRQNVVILTSSKKDGLIADDIGLRSFLDMLFGELILKQSVLRNTPSGNAANIWHLPESRGDIINAQVSDSDINNSDRMDEWMLENNQNNAENEANKISESQGWRGLDNNMQQNVRGYSDESDWLNVHRDASDNMKNQQRVLDYLLTNPLNNGRLLQVKRQDPLQIRGNQLNNDLKNSMLNSDLSEGRNTNANQQKNIMNLGVRADGRRQQNRFAMTGDDGTRDSGIRMPSVQLLLDQLQQLVARLNIEDISLRRSDNYLNTEENNLEQSHRIGDPSIGIRLDDRQRRVVLNKMNEISERLNGSLQKLIMEMSNIGQVNAIGNRLSGQIDQIVLMEILNEISSLSEYVPDGKVSSILENSTTQLLMRHIVNIVERQLQRLRSVRNNDDIVLNGVKINDADIDRLQTYVDYSNVDLSNMLRSNTGRNDEKNNQIVLGRIPRLNHKPFVIKVDVNSNQNQRVVVRTLLVPKVNALGAQLSPMQQRQNVVLLDIVNVNLKSGRNVIMRQSRDITWTGRDSTPYSEMYQRVMNALQIGLDLTNDISNGQGNMLPHRLLIPRGRTDGLQMQLLTVITPAEENIGEIRQDRKGLNAIALDNLPITYPLDRDLNDLNTIISLSNVHMKNVLIYHNDQLQISPQ